jgi:hypothetical protein
MDAKEKKDAVEEGEFFPTPREVVYALLESPLVELPGGQWIEPCAGTGRIISAINDIRTDIQWNVCELNLVFKRHLEGIMGSMDNLLPFGDFVHRTWDYPKAKVLIMNPPFSLTMQFVQAAMERAEWVVCLQRQAWFGSQGRSDWLMKHCPDSHQLSWRPSFRPDGKVDNCDYTWYVWPPGSDAGRPQGVLSMLKRPNGGQLNLL